MAVVNVRISGEAEQALAALTADGTSVSDAVRHALVQAALLRRREEMRAEAEQIRNDPADRAAINRVMEEWADVDPW